MGKRDNWTESDLAALPDGEHRDLERKSGLLFDKKSDEYWNDLAKAISALANSGGGILVLGVKDDGEPDGLPFHMGNTPTREWLEQKIPYLVDYRLSDFRVHEVVPADSSSRIPKDKVVIVVDVGDSPLAPHQSTRDKHYYYREAGHSVRAPHFYLELLRRRFTSPVLRVTATSLVPDQVKRANGLIKLERMTLGFDVHNEGRVAASKWILIIQDLVGYPDGRRGDYSLGGQGEVKYDLLPGCTARVTRHISISLRPQTATDSQLKAEIEQMIAGVSVVCVMSTDTSPAETYEFALSGIVDIDDLTLKIKKSLG